MIIVDHVKSRNPGEYMGRRMPGRAGSVLGNPYRIKDESFRADAVEQYAKWLRVQLSYAKSTQRIELRRLRCILESEGTLRLLCWCRTAEQKEPACHCDVIARALLERWDDEEPRLS